MTASAPTGWTAESGLTAGSRKYTHPDYPGWEAYDAGQGGQVAVYMLGGTFAQVDTLAAAVALIAAEHQ